MEFSLPSGGGRRSPRVSPKGDSLVADKFDGNSVLVFNGDDDSLPNGLIGHTSSIDHLLFSPDGRTLIAGNRATTFLWNLAVQRWIARFSFDQAYPSPRLSLVVRVLGRNLDGSKEFRQVGPSR